MWLVEESCAITFQSNWIYRFHLADNKMGVKKKKNHIDLHTEERPEQYTDQNIQYRITGKMCLRWHFVKITLHCLHVLEESQSEMSSEYSRSVSILFDQKQMNLNLTTFYYVAWQFGKKCPVSGAKR